MKDHLCGLGEDSKPLVEVEGIPRPVISIDPVPCLLNAILELLCGKNN